MQEENKTIIDRQLKQKEELISKIKQTPIIQVACQKIGIGRATYYRWRKNDKDFAKAADEALLEGKYLINDMAESQLISAIKDRNLTAIIFWLKNHHHSYATRVEVQAKIENLNQELTPEQKKIVDEALRLAALTDYSEPGKEKEND